MTETAALAMLVATGSLVAAALLGTYVEFVPWPGADHSADSSGVPDDESIDEPSRLRRGVAVARAGLLPAVGLALLGIGVTAWIRPSLIPTGLERWLQGVARDQLPYLTLGGLVGAVTLLVVTFGSRPDPRERVGAIDAPEPVDRTDARSSGHTVDELVATLGSRDGDDVVAAREEVRTHLRELAVQSLITYVGHTRSEAVERVRQGTWTDRADVAAFVGGDDAPAVPLLTALVDWLSAEATFERRVRRTVVELDRLRGDRR